MPSHKPRNSSKSGASEKSTNKDTSRARGNTSPTAAPSFELKGTPPDPRIQPLQQQLARATAALEVHSGLNQPTNKLLAMRHRAKTQRLRTSVQLLTEAIEDLKAEEEK